MVPVDGFHVAVVDGLVGARHFLPEALEVGVIEVPFVGEEVGEYSAEAVVFRVELDEPETGKYKAMLN